ncbi:hypothetical protein [Streptomyces sp. NBC_00258]|uniref:hypothetical protein n=1 Tax=Streptomyces sp. NBC_00258 TaxID=2903642 RepID=UPI003FA7C0EA
MSADTGPAIAPRGARKVFTTPPGELHTAVIGLDPTVGGCGFTAVVAPAGRGRSTTPTLVSGPEELTECEALVPDEPLDLREGTRDSVAFGARALEESPARVARRIDTASRARTVRGGMAVVAASRVSPLVADTWSLGTGSRRVTLCEEAAHVR